MNFDFKKIEKEKIEEIKDLKEDRSLIAAIEKAKKAGIIPIIAEVKKSSPSKGKIRDIEHIEAANSMEKGGACILSVLTDKNFDGKVCYLRQVKGAVKLPVLRKDFIVDMFQLYESRGNGANAVLLIAALLKDKTTEYVDKAHELGMGALVEVHGEEDLGYALSSGARLIGINNRDLKTLKVELGTTERLAPKIPKDRIIVAESGINNVEDIRRLQKVGATAFLVGTSIMSTPDIEKKVRELTGR
ncbi:MAG: indole-3-glycerol phosphate synthase TrpC [Candidatus Altiarchaeia archaeon]